MYHIYADGACSGNKKYASSVGGYGYVIIDTLKKKIIHADGGSVGDTTNNRMELTAAISSLQYVISIENDNIQNVKCALLLDSNYVVDNWNEYIEIWSTNNWKKTNGSKVLNIDLWKLLYKISKKFKALKFQWVKGHSSQKFNELADGIATKYVQEYKRMNKC